MNKNGAFVQTENLTAISLEAKKRRFSFGKLLTIFLFVLLAATFFAAGIYSGDTELLPQWWLEEDEYLASDGEVDGSESSAYIDVDYWLEKYGEVCIESSSDGSVYVSAASTVSYTFGVDAFNNGSRQTEWSSRASNSSKSDWSLIRRKYTSNTSTVNVGGTTFTELRNKNLLQYYVNGNWSKDRGDWEDGRYCYYNGQRGWRLNNNYWTDCPTGLSSVACWAEASVKGLKKGVTVWTDIAVCFKSKDTTAPTISVASTSLTTWAQSKTVTFVITDNANASTNLSTKTCKVNNSSGSNMGYGQSGTNFTTSSSVTTPIYWQVRDRSNNYGSKTFSLAEMKIDRTAPTVNSVGFYATGTTTALGTYTTGAVDIRCYAADGQSGIKSVVAKNNQTGTTYTMTHLGNGIYRCQNVTNGSYTITATDNVSLTSTASGTYCGIDQHAPVISASFANTTSTSYAKDAVLVTFTITDRAGLSNTAAATETTIANKLGDTYKNLRGLKAQTDSNKENHGFWFKGQSSVTNASTKACLTVTNVSGYPQYSGGVYTYKYTVHMPFKGSYTFKATDKAGKSASSGSLNGSNGSTITTYIDTTAPYITSISATSEALTKWTSAASITLTVNVSDSPKTTNINNGSGLSKVTLAKNAGSGSFTTQTVSLTGGKTSAQFTLTANYDEIQSYKILVYDVAGNTSDSPSATAAKTINGVSYSNYFVNDNNASNKTPIIYKDARPVTTTVFKDEACTVQYAAKDKTFIDQWRKATNTTFYVKVVFGPSGGTLYQQVNNGSKTTVNTNVTAPTGQEKYPDGKTNSTFCKSNNTVVYKITVSAQGPTDYVYTFTNGANVSATSGKMTTRLDTTAPVAKLLGFGTSITSGNYKSEADVKSHITGFISESEMYGRTDWYGSVLNAYILMSDTYSGVAGVGQSYNDKQDSTLTQATGAKTTVTFKYNGYTATQDLYTYTGGNKGGLTYPAKLGDMYVLTVPLFNYIAKDATGSILRAATKSGTSIVKADGSLDLNWGSNSPFVYNITVHDFIGNEAKVTNKVNSADLAYKVDPFKPTAAVTSIKTASGAYDYTALGDSNSKWTREAVEITVTKTQMGLSETRVQYGTVNISDVVDDETG
ncbi:MAG: hypothetical protein IJ735_01735 [Clostridia bacterium]|nr:hypothetical protein [Clostridia bacterium]